jgi:hypothetical protein
VYCYIAFVNIVYCLIKLLIQVLIHVCKNWRLSGILKVKVNQSYMYTSGTYVCKNWRLSGILKVKVNQSYTPSI